MINLLYHLLYHVINIGILMSVLIGIFLIVRKFVLKTRFARLTLFIYSVFFVRLLIPYNIHAEFRDKSTEPVNLISSVLNYQSWLNQGLIRLEEVDVNLINTSAQQATHRGISVADLILIAWILGIFIFLGTILNKHFSFHRKLMLLADPNTDTKVQTVVNEISKELNIKKPIEVYLSYTFSPMVIGIRHQKLIIPRSCCTPDVLYWTVYHELVHIKRHDVIYQLLALIANAIYWPNPLMHILRRVFEIDLECACDERVWKNRTNAEKKQYYDIIADLTNEEVKALSPLSSGLFSDKEVLNYRYTRGTIELTPTGVIPIGIGAASIIVTASLLTNPFSTDVISNRNLTFARSSTITQKYAETNEDIASFATMFVNEFTRSVYNKTDMDFEKYIRNENLLAYADKMQQLTILQEELETGAVPLNATNELLDVSIGMTDEHMYLVSIQSKNNNVSILAQLLIYYNSGNLWVEDFYIGIPKGIEHLLVGPLIGNDVISRTCWNDSVMTSTIINTLNTYEQELMDAK